MVAVHCRSREGRTSHHIGGCELWFYPWEQIIVEGHSLLAYLYTCPVYASGTPRSTYADNSTYSNRNKHAYYYKLKCSVRYWTLYLTDYNFHYYITNITTLIKVYCKSGARVNSPGNKLIIILHRNSCCHFKINLGLTRPWEFVGVFIILYLIQ